MKEESEKTGLNLNTEKIMASSSITSLQKDGETVTDFTFFASKIISDDDCSHGTKRHFLLVNKAVASLESILKRRDITLPTKFHLIKAMVFPVVIYDCESWGKRKAEFRRTDAYELWC